MRHIGVGQLIVCLVVFASLLVFEAAGRCALAADTFSIAFIEKSPESLWGLWLEQVYTEALRRVGRVLEYKTFPPARVSVMVNSGQVDGESGRIKGHEARYPNLVMVDEPIIEMNVLAVAKDPGICIESWEGFRGTAYRVDYYRGIDIMEQHLPGLVSANRLFSISAPVQAFRKLIAGRTDIYVDMSVNILPLLASPEFKDSGIRVVGTLATIPVYPYVHKRHAELAPQLAKVLRQMKAEGLLDAYMEQAKQRFASK